MSLEETIVNLIKLPLFAELSDTEIFSLAREAKTKNYHKDKVIFLNTEKADFFYIILSGWVKLYRETIEGNEAILDVISEGSIFGETVLLEKKDYNYSSEAIEDSVLIQIPLSSLNRLIESNHKFVLRMLQLQLKYRDKFEVELEHRDLQSAAQRIGCFIIDISKGNNNETIELSLPYEKTLLASRLGMKPETFSRALNKLRSDTGIKIDGSNITIPNSKKLHEYCCRACSGNTCIK